MTSRRALIPISLAFALSIFSCRYVVIPADLDVSTTRASQGWSAMAIGLSQTDAGALRIDLAIRNDTGDWSTMQAAEGKPATLSSAGKSVKCDQIVLGTGGHRLAPGFQMRGFVGGTPSRPEVQMLGVECQGAEAALGAKLSVEYNYVTGQYNYYEQDKGRVDTKLEVNLDEVTPDLTYPIAEETPGLVQTRDTPIVALNKVVLELTDVQRTDNGLQFGWSTSNPGEYPSIVHIGNPPAIGQDGILYGFYETPDIVSVPLTPAGAEAEWTTQVEVPPEVTGLYMLLSVETGKARLFANYVIDITDQ
jgi:hypothetical protein